MLIICCLQGQLYGIDSYDNDIILLLRDDQADPQNHDGATDQNNAPQTPEQSEKKENTQIATYVIVSAMIATGLYAIAIGARWCYRNHRTFVIAPEQHNYQQPRIITAQLHAQSPSVRSPQQIVLTAMSQSFDSLPATLNGSNDSVKITPSPETSSRTLLPVQKPHHDELSARSSKTSLESEHISVIYAAQDAPPRTAQNTTKSQ